MEDGKKAKKEKIVVKAGASAHFKEVLKNTDYSCLDTSVKGLVAQLADVINAVQKERGATLKQIANLISKDTQFGFPMTEGTLKTYMSLVNKQRGETAVTESATAVKKSKKRNVKTNDNSSVNQNEAEPVNPPAPVQTQKQETPEEKGARLQNLANQH